jgi:hypothetical protein
MYVEYTKQLDGRAFRDVQIAITERTDNLLRDNLSEAHTAALNKLMSQTFLRLNDYMLLSEMAAQTHKVWTAGEDIPIYFFGGDPDIKKKVFEYAQEWSLYGNLNFSLTQNPNNAKLRVGFENNGSWSYIGTDARGVPKSQSTINFGWLTKTLPERDFKQVVLHEFGHALGLVHEHQSPAAGVKWNKPFVYAYCLSNYGWNKSKTDINIIDCYETSSTQHSALDKASIMGYYIPPEFTLNNEQFPLNYELSDMDKKYIGNIYPTPLYS